MSAPGTQAIALIQTRLRIEVVPGLVCDGIAGPRTEAAIAHFWQKLGRSREARIDDVALLPTLLPGLVVDRHGDPSWGFYARHRGVRLHPESRGKQVPGVHGAFHPKGVLIHHTAGPAGRVHCPFERFAEGREDLSGPIVQFTTSRDGTGDAITHGRAHHAGKGDAAVLTAMEVGAPAGKLKPTEDSIQGNTHLYGIEVDHTGHADEPIGHDQLATTVAIAAMWCQAWGWAPEVHVIGHLEWTRRKRDPVFVSMDVFRGMVRNHIYENPLDMRPQAAVCPCCGSTLIPKVI